MGQNNLANAYRLANGRSSGLTGAGDCVYREVYVSIRPEDAKLEYAARHGKQLWQTPICELPACGSQVKRTRAISVYGRLALPDGRDFTLGLPHDNPQPGKVRTHLCQENVQAALDSLTSLLDAESKLYPRRSF